MFAAARRSLATAPLIETDRDGSRVLGYLLGQRCRNKLDLEQLNGQEDASHPHAYITSATPDNKQRGKCDL